MAALAGAKTVGAPLSNGRDIVDVYYDFSVDGGATGTYDVLTVDDACVVRMLYGHVKAAVTGSGLTLNLGVTGGDVDAMLDTTSGAVANLGLAAIIQPELTQPVYVPNAGVVALQIAGGAATAGRVRFVFEIMKP